MKTPAVQMQLWAAMLKFRTLSLAVISSLLAAATTETLVTRTLDSNVKKMVLAEARVAVSGAQVG
jgi:hypothetical protein